MCVDRLYICKKIKKGLKDEMYEIILTITTVCETLFVVPSLIIALVTYLNNKKKEKAESIVNLWSEFIHNDDLYEAMHRIEFDDYWFNDDFYCTKVERQMDRLFIYLNQIVYLNDKKIIKQEEFEMFLYKIHAVFDNLSTQKYFQELEKFSAEGRSAKPSFYLLIEFGRKHNLYK